MVAIETNQPTLVSTRLPVARRRRRRQLQDRQYAVLLMLPAAVVLAVLVGWPLVELIKDSLYSGVC